MLAQLGLLPLGVDAHRAELVDRERPPPRPARCCLKMTGPGLVSLIATPAAIRTGDSSSRPTLAPTRSSARFHARHRLDEDSLPARRRGRWPPDALGCLTARRDAVEEVLDELFAFGDGQALRFLGRGVDDGQRLPPVSYDAVAVARTRGRGRGRCAVAWPLPFALTLTWPLPARP